MVVVGHFQTIWGSSSGQSVFMLASRNCFWVIEVMFGSLRTLFGPSGVHVGIIGRPFSSRPQLICTSSGVRVLIHWGSHRIIQWPFLNHRRGSCRHIGGCDTGCQEAIVRSSNIHIRLIGGHIRIKGDPFLIDGVWCMLQVLYYEMHDGS